MKRSLSILAVLLLAGFIQAAEVEFEQIYSGRTKDGAVTAEGKTFKIHPLSEDRVRITFPSGRIELMRAGDCDSDFYRVCIITIEYSTDDKEFDIEAQEYPIYTELRIYSPGEVVDFTRTFDEETFLVGEMIDVKVEITNDGSLVVDEAIYLDALPASIETSNMEGCVRQGAEIRWSGSLAVNARHECSYTMRATRNLTHEAQATLSYWEQTVTQSTTLTIQPPPLVIWANLSKQTLDLLEMAELTLFVANTHDEVAITNLDVKATFPDGFSVTKIAGKADQIGDAYHLRGQLPAEENRTLVFQIQPRRLGNVSLEVSSRYVLGQDFTRAFVTEERFPIEVETKELSIITGEQRISEGSVVIPVTVFNGNPVHSYKNIRISGKGDVVFDQGEIYIEILAPGETYETEFSAQRPLEVGEYDLGAKVTYSTMQGESFEAEDVGILEVGIDEASVPNQDSEPSEPTVQPSDDPEPSPSESEETTTGEEEETLAFTDDENFVLFLGAGLAGLLVLIIIVAVWRFKRG